ncbi:hypothetical protein [Rhodococcus erythropolis]|uniref:hypothetical protein n=1 Tax=Rhodococcus erythropolis TaxID=1833 RepID=UPI0008791411|nr:hypothetical protein [Rhodococcus erythropolis]OFV72773.1 hypothetical protein RERY_65890 [Rhodococcus erythropolis]
MLMFFALAALAVLLVWKIGAPVARFGGALMVVSSLVFIVAGDPIGPRLVVLVAGVALWLAGHFLAAYKGRCWRSRLAESLVVRTPLRYIDPVNGRECRQNRREARNEAVEPEREPGEEARRPRVDHFAEWERELDSDAAPAPVRPRRPANRPRAHARSARPSRGVVYGKRAAKLAATVATRTVPGARIARSALRFLR